ncbi:NTP pyrophosphohydrolase [Colletotrichum karsti]|uniref:NTP pyrophosphohydrolase n=1 Tax=Colletotrichum karsti TaxID=1095194 RepID=A0A9P6LQ04_9PEZI|nr:NTP pyrophosphohydrolase [Colletotrichum karsti]KAF9880187.1 NTP pyrophosphohydrolase [Colletotrichum karsti]
MKYLTMTRDDIKSMNTHANIDKVTVGAGILRFDTNGPKILLLRRNANEKYYPNVFEMPGGKVDATDTSIRDALVREVAEETSLHVRDVLGPLQPITYTTEKREKDASGHDKIISRKALQLSYVVTVQEGTDFKVNPAEHSMGIWTNLQALSHLTITEEMKSLVTEVLSWADKQMPRNTKNWEFSNTPSFYTLSPLGGGKQTST